MLKFLKRKPKLEVGEDILVLYEHHNTPFSATIERVSKSGKFALITHDNREMWVPNNNYKIVDNL